MKLFGPLHLTLLAAIAVVAVALVILCRSGRLSARAASITLGSGLALNEIVWWITRYSREGIHAGNLPLQLCDAAVWIAILACMTRAPALAEFTWFAGIAGAGMALLTPDLAAPWPQWPAIYFFLAHGGVVIAAALLAFSGVMRFEPRSVWRPFGMLVAYAAFVGCVDALLHSNYMYLRNKPGSASVLDLAGPWPWYIAAGAALGLALFWLLWLPVRPARPPDRAVL
jgi:hypothetical integral membrane protein (TIGR02206 family)